jgi:hypothetical protein
VKLRSPWWPEGDSGRDRGQAGAASHRRPAGPAAARSAPADDGPDTRATLQSGGAGRAVERPPLSSAAYATAEKAGVLHAARAVLAAFSLTDGLGTECVAVRRVCVCHTHRLLKGPRRHHQPSRTGSATRPHREPAGSTDDQRAPHDATCGRLGIMWPPHAAGQPDAGRRAPLPPGTRKREPRPPGGPNIKSFACRPRLDGR